MQPVPPRRWPLPLLQLQSTDPPRHTMDRLPIKPFAAIALGCLLGFGLVDLAKQDRRALAHCEQRGGSVAECRLVVSGR